MAAAATPGPASGRRGIFATKSTEVLVGDTQRGAQLKKAVGALSLTALGIGAIIGNGIFVIIGEAIGDSGPAIVISFMLAGLTCVFSALAYSELASAIPVSGSAYTYSYATLGELVAWIIGWDLILEYGFASATVAVGWGGYLKALLDSLFGITLPNSIAEPVGKMGGVVNVPAVFLVLAVTAVLVLGVRESARFNAAMVFVKLGILLFFIVLGATAFHGANFQPFAPKGVSGVTSAAALIFFAYIGFDAISTSSEEAENPKRDLPRAIVGALAFSTVVYILVALVTTGLLPFGKLAGSESPLADAIEMGAGYSWAANIVSFGALVAITSVVLTLLFGQTRIMFSMCRDGLLPQGFAKISPRRQTPVRITLTFGVFVALIAAFVPLSTLTELVNIGTLFAFVVVNIGIVILRRTKPDMPRSFRMPLANPSFPLFPALGVILSVYLMSKLEGATWVRFLIWMAIGLVVYAAYGYRHSRLRRGEEVNPEAELPGTA